MRPVIRIKAKHLADTLSVLAVLLALIWWIAPDVLRPRRPVIYVSPEGSDWNPGSSPKWALATIQRAVDRAGPGTSVVLLPGVYRQRVQIRNRGTGERPITIRAQRPGSVVLTGAADERTVRDLQWKPTGDGGFVAGTPWPVHEVTVGDQHLFRCRKPEDLSRLASRPSSWGAFHASGNVLRVRLKNDGDPRHVPLAINGAVPPRLANGLWRASNVWLEGSHLRFEGLRFQCGVNAGLHIFAGNDVAVRDCLFGGARVAVHAKEARRLTIEHCAYVNYPQGRWRRRWLTWREAYDSPNLGHGLVLSTSSGVVVRHNVVAHAADGMHVSPADTADEHGADVSHNLIAFCHDDAIEFDGPSQHVRFYHNLVFDCHESLGTSPVLTGPVEIAHNLFLHPSDGINGAQVKLLNPWRKRKPPLNGPIRNVLVRNNTFVGNWLCWWNESAVEDFHVQGNVFAVRHRKTPAWPAGVQDAENLHIELAEKYPNPALDERWLRNTVRLSASQGATPSGCLWTMKRPGPRWLDWRSQPGTRQLCEFISEEIFR
jgi:hypothetical protein